MGLLRYRDPTSGNWVDISVSPHVHDEYVPLSGGDMIGDIELGGQKLTGLGAPVAGDDALTKGYADSFAVPVGTVSAFGGAAAPLGWHLCDASAHGSAALEAVIGSATTPDLRDRFILAAGPTYAVATAGGEAAHVLTEAEMPSHTHGIYDAGHAHYQYVTSGSGAGAWRNDYGADGSGHLYPQEANTSHEVTSIWVDPAGSSLAHNNMPPYYALTFIIKT